MPNSNALFVDTKLVNSWLVRVISFTALALLSILVYIAQEALHQQKFNAAKWQSLAVESATSKVEMNNLAMALNSNTQSLKAFEQQFTQAQGHFVTDDRVERLSRIFGDKTVDLDRRLTVMEAQYERK